MRRASTYLPAYPFASANFPKGSLWTTSQPFANMARRPGVYVIYLDGVLTYVGQSVNVLYRVMEHMRENNNGTWTTPWGQARSIMVKAKYTQRLGDWLMWEHRLIQRLRPIGNVRLCRAVAIT